mmetsp:Transcript_16434/g.27866  ORF Transcript_16434/g.27866 Transcript_16434/m.27866 type:complete len:84 (+) Transcript_16434:1056-1307(+)
MWLVQFAYIVSLNDVKAGSGIQEKDIEWEETNVYLAIYMLFGICWVTAWLEYSNKFVIMVSASSYYFDSSPERDGEADVGLGF